MSVSVYKMVTLKKPTVACGRLPHPHLTVSKPKVKAAGWGCGWSVGPGVENKKWPRRRKEHVLEGTVPPCLGPSLGPSLH